MKKTVFAILLCVLVILSSIGPVVQFSVAKMAVYDQQNYSFDMDASFDQETVSLDAVSKEEQPEILELSPNHDVTDIRTELTMSDNPSLYAKSNYSSATVIFDVQDESIREPSEAATFELPENLIANSVAMSVSNSSANEQKDSLSWQESTSSSAEGTSTTVFYENFEGAFPGSWSVGDSNPTAGSDYWDDTSYRAYGGSWSGWCADIGTQSETTTTTIFYENFEGAWPGSWSVGDWDSGSGYDYWGDYYWKYHEGHWSGYCADEGSHPSGSGYDNDMEAYMYRSVSLSGYSSVTLSYWYWTDIEDYWDKLYVLYKDGGTWWIFDKHTGNSAGWRFSSISIPTTATHVGFYFSSDSSVCDYGGAFVDEVKLEWIGQVSNKDVHKYDHYMDSYLSRGPFDARNWDLAYFTFYAWIDTESGYDFITFDTSGSGSGGPWHELWSRSGSYKYWGQYTERIPDYDLTSNLWVGFDFISDSSVAYEGVYLDNIALKWYDVTLDSYNFDPSNVNPGDSFTLGYYVDNPTPYSINVGLGASIRDPSNSEISDLAHDTIVSVSPGTHWFYRDFTVPSWAETGLYDVAWGIWSGTPGSSRWWGGSDWQSNILTVASPNHAPALSESYVDPNPGYLDTNFKFLVKYTDQDGDAAVVRKLYVYDGGWQSYDMDHLAGNPTIGEWFLIWLDGFSLGSHNFYFYFTDGDLSDREPISGYYSFDVVERPKPDLIISDITWIPEIPTSGDTMTFTIYIKNQGSADTSAWGSFNVPYYIDNNEEGEWTINNIAAGDTISKQFQWTATEGSHTVSAYADKGGFIPESYENNNDKQKSFNVAAPRGRMGISISTETISRVPTQAPAGMIVIYGIWKYTGVSGGPVRRALVELYDDDPLGSFKIADTYTDDNGYFEFPAINNDDGWLQDGLDVWVKLKVETEPTGGLYVTDYDLLLLGETYYARTPKVSNIPDGTWSIYAENTCVSPQTSVAYTVDDPDNRGALGVYHAMLDEYLWLRYESGVNWIQPKIHVIWPHPSATEFVHGLGMYHINIRQTHTWNVDVSQHEYAHAVMYKLYGDSLPSGWGPSPHRIFDESTGGFALKEGWAQFLPGAVQNSANYRGSNMETESFADVIDNNDMDGDIVEGAVACTLWDLADDSTARNDGSLGSDDDGVSGKFIQLWNVFKNHKPNDINEFWDGWFDEGYGYRPEMNSIFWEQRIDKNEVPLALIVSPNDGGWYSGVITITVNVQDIDGSVTQVQFQYSIDGTSWYNIDMDYSSPWSVLWDTSIIGSDSSVWVRARAHDDMEWSLWDKCDQSFSVDNTEPDVEVLSPLDGATVTTSNVEVTWTGQDSASGTNHYEVRLDSGPWIDKGLSTDHTFSGVAGGSHVVEVKAIDNVGLENTDSHSFNVVLLDGEISDYVVLTPTAMAGEKLRVEATVENTGAIRTEYNVYIGNIWDSEGASAGNAYSESHQIIQLDPGDSQTLTLEWTTPDTMLLGDYTGDLHLQMARPGSGWEKHREYANAISFTVKEEKLSVTIDPNGGRIYVDGNPITTSTTYQWMVGSSHNLDPDSGYSPSMGTKLIFTQWSDGNTADSRTITVTASTTYTGLWNTQYQLTISVSSSGSGTTSPSTGSYWYNSGTSATVSATPNTEYTLSYWDLDGSKAGTETSYSVLMDSPHSLTAVFSLITISVKTWEIINEYKVDEMTAYFNQMMHVKKAPIACTVHVYFDSPVVELIQRVSLKFHIPGADPERVTGEMEEIEAGHYRLYVKMPASVSEGDLANMAYLALELIAAYFGVMLAPPPWYTVPSCPAAYLEEIIVVDVGGKEHHLTESTAGQHLPDLLPTYCDALTGTTMAFWSGEFQTTYATMCPLDMLVTDPSGRRIGTLYEDGVYVGEVNEIPESFYSGSGLEIEVIILPSVTGDYIVELFGIGQGEFYLAGVVINNEEANSNTVIGSVLEGSISRYESSVSDLPTVTFKPVGYAYTQKLVYYESEIVTLGFNNSGNVPIELSTSDPWVILNGSGQVVFDPLENPTSIVLNPGDVKEWQWNQIDNYGQQVSPGTYFLKIETSAGNFTASFSIVDVTPPTITILLPENTTYTTNTVALTFTVSESTSWIGYSLDGQTNITITENTTLTALAEDPHHIIVYANDTYGNTGFSSKVYFTIDTIPPTTSISLSGTLGLDGWYVSDVTVTLTATDEVSGVAITAYSFDGASWFTYAGEPFAITDEGITIVYYNSTDDVGNVEDTKSTTVKIDKTNPTITIDPAGALGNDDWYLSDVSMTLGASDPMSGILTMEYSFDNIAWVVYAVPFTIEAEGTTTVYGRSTDNAGNVETAVVDVRIDKTPPNLTKSLLGTLGNNDWYVSDVTVTLSGSDSVSGLDSIQYSFDGTMWYTYSTPFVVNTEGLTTLYHKASDIAGNEFVLIPQQIKIDKTSPTITATLSPATSNIHLWYNEDVTIHFAATDSVSGVAYVSPDVILSEGAGQSASGMTEDNAGNVATLVIPDINIDKTSPTITGAPTKPANAWNWYCEDVTVHFTASDSLSGVDYVTPDQIISTEGSDQSTTGTATDLAGNSVTYTVSGINIDKTPPTITGAPTDPANSYGWYNVDVIIHFTASDSLSGVDTVTPDQTISSEGADQSITGYVTDKAGNTASHTVAGINIDKTSPTITGAPTTLANIYGWYNTDVVVHFEATDSLSGIESITPDQILSGEGADQSATGTATDKAGNTASYTVSGINIDKTPPIITGDPITPANSYGWHNTDVTIYFEATDALSGMATITPDQTLTSEGAGQSVTGTATDKAGNSASYTVSGINIDKTAPMITGAPTTPANAHGWYNTDVTVHFVATDTFSGVLTVTPDQTLTTEGADQAVTGTATDLAGNEGSYTVSGINIDKTSPSITGSPTTPANAYSWYNTDVIVHFDASDSLSGLYAVTPDQTLSSEGAGQSVTGTAVDLAGNEASYTVSGINIDKTSPTITGAPTISPNAYGWYNHDVTIHFEATDALSGIETITPDTTLSTEGASQSATGYATDMAGNTASYTVSDINIDKTPPTITGAPTTSANAHNWYKTDVVVHFEATDSLSGIDAVTPDQTLSAEAADQSVTGTATDKAGNTASHTVSGINIDKTPPTIAGAPTTAANVHGWYNTDVTIHFEATDSLSGLDTLTLDQTLTSEGAAQSVTGTAIDKAGNSASHTVSSINIDKTPPTITGAPTTPANAHGWYKTDVIVHFETSDSLSGLDSVTPDQTLTAEGAGQSVIGTAIDKAGNTASCTVDGINIDKTPPEITGAPTTPANAYGWYNTDVTVHFEASDSLSGLLTLTPDTTLSAEGADQSVTGTAVDLAENEVSCTVSGINIDKTPPTIMGAPTTSPNVYGWYNHDVTVHFTASDALSGLDTVTPDQILTGEGADQSVTGVAVDNAGNSASCTIGGINIDKTTPATSLSIGEPKFGTDPTYVSTSTDFTLDAADAISDVDYIECKIDSGAWTTYSTPFNVLDFDSHTLYYRSVDIAGNIEDIQSIWIVVNAASISYSGDTSGQYSDAVTVNAILIDMATQQSIEGKTIIFTIGSQTVTATTDSLGLATATIVLDQPEGTHTVSATFSGDTDYFACLTTQSFTIQKENAEPEYTGDTVVPTTAKSINLRATVFDSPDGWWGDLTKMQVIFSIYVGVLGSSNLLMTIPAVPVSQTETPGVGVAVITIDNLPENGYLIIVSIDSNDYYEGPTSDATPLTVYEPTGAFVTGGGWIWDPSGSKGNFGFNIKYNKRGKPQGHSIYVYREDGWNYIVKSNAWIGLAIDGNHAYFEAKCVVQKYNPTTGELAWAEGNYKFRVDVWGNDSDGGVDIYQIRVRDKHGVLYHEAGFNPLGELQGGNIVIHDERRKKP